MFEVSGLVEISAFSNKKFNSCHACIASLGKHSINVWLRDKNTMIINEP